MVFWVVGVKRMTEWAYRDVPRYDETTDISPDYDPDLDAPKGPFQYERVPITRHLPGTIQNRWCPTHRRWEQAVVGERLRCGAAWAELYKMEREVEAEKMGVNGTLLQLGESISELAEEIKYGERTIAEPPTRPRPTPPPLPPPTAPQLPRSGRGGVSLP